MSIRPTADGTAVLVLAVLLLFVAINLQAGWVFAVDALLWGALAVGWAGAWTALRGVGVSRALPAEVCEGDPVSVTLTLCVRRGRRYAVTLRDAVPGLSSSTVVVPVVSSRPVTVSYLATALRRGVHLARDVEVTTMGLLGLVGARGRLPAGGSVVVLPRYWTLDRLPSAGPAQSDGRVRRPRRDGLDVAGVRDYRDGDSLRHVHWRSTARRGRLVVREFDDDLHEPVAVLLDTRPHLYEGADDAFEDLVRACASVAHLATRSGRPALLVGSADPEVAVLPWPHALRWLASVRPGGDRSPVDQHALLPAGSRAVVATADADSVLALARRGVALAAVLADVDSYRHRTGVSVRARASSAGVFGGSVLALEALEVPVAVLRCGDDLGAVLARWGT